MARTLRHDALIRQQEFTEYANDPDHWADDDCSNELYKLIVLNRIDQGWGCDAIIDRSEAGPLGFPIYCGVPEHDPFTNRCWDHANPEPPHHVCDEWCQTCREPDDYDV